MPAPSVHAPHIPLMSLDSPSDSAVTTLYRAALGPVDTERYVQAFARLDAMGRTLTSWHWAACFFTLGWMVYRQLWGAALVYVAAAEGVALLVFGLGRPLLQWPQAVEWGVVGAFAVLGSVVPGLYAHAILHADIRKRVTKALAASANIPEACDLLAKQAVSRKRLTWVIAGHALLAGAAGMVLLAGAAAWMLRGQMVGPLHDAVLFANLMAAGDLSARFKGQTSGDFGDLGRLGDSAVPLQPQFRRYPARGGAVAKDRGRISDHPARILGQGARANLDIGRVCRKPDGAVANHRR